MKEFSLIKYSKNKHSHIFAAWAASSAASSSPKCRFKVEVGKIILEKSGFDENFVLERIKLKSIDKDHKKWREKIIKVAYENKLYFTHGIAAKLINCYLKARFVCGGSESDKRIAVLHPPIDRILLTGLAEANEICSLGRQYWKGMRDHGWSNFNSDAYEDVIKNIRIELSGDPLWKIEKYWSGYQ